MKESCKKKPIWHNRSEGNPSPLSLLIAKWIFLTNGPDFLLTLASCLFMFRRGRWYKGYGAETLCLWEIERILSCRLFFRDKEEIHLRKALVWKELYWCCTIETSERITFALWSFRRTFENIQIYIGTWIYITRVESSKRFRPSCERFLLRKKLMSIKNNGYIIICLHAYY